MSERNRNKLPNNLPQLQNLIKRDPGSYKDEFHQQLNHYRSNMQIFLLKPSQFSKTLSELVMFLAQVAHCYADELVKFPQELCELLQQHATVLDPEIRMTLCKALIFLRNKNMIPAPSLLELFFGLFRCQDKLLRKTLSNYIVQDVKNVNAKHKNAKLNTTLQNFMYTMLRDNNAVAAKMSLDVMIELYRKNIWRDSKTVNVISTACFSNVAKILVAGLQFFLGKDDAFEADDSDSDDEPEMKTSRELQMAHRVGRKTRKRKKRLDRALTNLKKHKKKKRPETFNFSALHLIHDPQGFAEKLFKQLEVTNERFEVKVMMINLISRLVGVHELLLLNFYPYVQRFLQPHQREVTKLLQYSAQASHNLVPPDVLEPVLKTIANNFITERNSAEVMAVGLNTVREICIRSPLAISQDLLQDLVQYKTHKVKTVMMAAQSLIRLFQKLHPDLLQKKFKGRPTELTKELDPLQYGGLHSKDYIPGAEVLDPKVDSGHGNQAGSGNENEDDSDGWESDSEDNESDGSWVEVQHSDDEPMQVPEEVQNMTSEEKRERARDVLSTRILTQNDFHKIRKRQLDKELAADRGPNKKRKRPNADADLDQERSDLVSLAQIERVHKKRAHDKESRLQTVLAGREGRGKFSYREKRQNPMASTTNKEKAKKKNFMMIKQKLKAKDNKRSFRDKQIALRNSLLKRAKNKK